MARTMSRAGAAERRPKPVARRLLGMLALALPLCVSVASPVAVSDEPGEALAALPADLQTLSALSRHPDFRVEEDRPATDDGVVYVRDAGRSILAERGGRVAPSRHPLVQPRFAAGRVMAAASLLRPGLALGDREMRTALAGPQPFAAGLQIAANFRKPGSGSAVLDATPAAIAVASLEPVAAPRPVAARGTETAELPAAAAEALAAYAPAGTPGAGSLFDAVLAPRAGGFVPPLGKGDHSWAATQLPASSTSAREQTCLANGIYFEARGESELGQAAVAQVILNRVRNPSYPKTICGVVYQNASWRNRCQFSFACDGIKDVIWNKRAYGTARRIAGEATSGETWLPEVGSATHYHATYVNPRWAATMQKVDKIGLHVFYRTFGGGWR